MALLLVKRGLVRVRPLAGGIEAWRQLGLPLVAHGPADREDPIAGFA